jgi:hypothetical protein
MEGFATVLSVVAQVVIVGERVCFIDYADLLPKSAGYP